MNIWQIYHMVKIETYNLNVSLVGFGTFKVAKRKARKGRNPQTGEGIDIAASKVPKFVAGKALKTAVK